MRIQFEAGTSRHGNYGVNFMISEDRSLYAEVKVPEGASDDYGYMALKNEIARQAQAQGITGITYWYDGQEQ